MAVQNSPLFNSLPPEVLQYTLYKAYISDIRSFANTCREAHQIISNSWAEFCTKDGFSEKEAQYCIFTSKCIQVNFPRLFDTITSQLPYLLSSKGLTFCNKDGVLTNAKCVFNSGSSALTFRCYSENRICSVVRLKSCTSSFLGPIETIFDQPSLGYSDSYAHSLDCISTTVSSHGDTIGLTTVSSHKDRIIDKQNFEKLNILFKKTELCNFELSKAKPLQIELPLMGPEMRKFDADHFNVQKLREVKSTIKLTEVISTISWKHFSYKAFFFSSAVFFGYNLVIDAMNYFQPNSPQNPSVCNMQAIDMLHLQCYI